MGAKKTFFLTLNVKECASSGLTRGEDLSCEKNIFFLTLEIIIFLPTLWITSWQDSACCIVEVEYECFLCLFECFFHPGAQVRNYEHLAILAKSFTLTLSVWPRNVYFEAKIGLGKRLTTKKLWSDGTCSIFFDAELFGQPLPGELKIDDVLKEDMEKLAVIGNTTIILEN